MLSVHAATRATLQLLTLWAGRPPAVPHYANGAWCQCYASDALRIKRCAWPLATTRWSWRAQRGSELGAEVSTKRMLSILVTSRSESTMAKERKKR